MTEKERLDQAMKKILSVSKTELQTRIEAEKQSKQTTVNIAPRTTPPGRDH